jgi:hypothetical protein
MSRRQHDRASSSVMPDPRRNLTVDDLQQSLKVFIGLGFEVEDRGNGTASCSA